ncbi:Type IV inositol polyphosphate 5-phosphatase 3, partial [Linum perenne]
MEKIQRLGDVIQHGVTAFFHMGKDSIYLNYMRTKLKLYDHRPVTATFMVEVEVFYARRLQRALAFTNAEVQNEEVEIGLEMGISHLQIEE